MAKLNAKDVDLSTLNRTYKGKKWSRANTDFVRSGKARYNPEQSNMHNKISEDRNRLTSSFSDWHSVSSDKYRDNYDRIFK